VLPNAAAGLSQLPGEQGKDALAIARGLAEGELSGAYLLRCDPLRELPGAELWERALSRAGGVIAHAAFLTEGIERHADVVFPAESYAEKEGTLVHPDGRIQRLRPAIARPGQVRAEWLLIAELAGRLGLELDVLSGPMASAQLFEAVPFYAGLRLEQISGRGVRWQERDAAAHFPAAQAQEPARAAKRLAKLTDADRALLPAHRTLWDAPEVELSPALRFLFPRAIPAAAPPNGRARPILSESR
jgi:NADH-quinone oxidoreductase subunit G